MSEFELRIFRSSRFIGWFCHILFPPELTCSQAWHQKQFDIVEHMYKSAQSAQRRFDPSTAESLADVLYEMGKSLLNTYQYPLAVKWLDRALGILADQELEKLSMDASELRISIIQSTVKARLQLKDDKSLEEARDHVQVLENELGDRLVVLIMRLEILDATATDGFDSFTFSNILSRIIRTVVLNDGNFKLVMFHIRKLNAEGPVLACKSLDDFFRLRILAEKNDDDSRNAMVEKVLITRIWMGTGQRDTPDALLALEDFLSVVSQNSATPISSNATLAAHTVNPFPFGGVRDTDNS